MFDKNVAFLLAHSPPLSFDLPTYQRAASLRTIGVAFSRYCRAAPLHTCLDRPILDIVRRYCVFFRATWFKSKKNWMELQWKMFQLCSQRKTVTFFMPRFSRLNHFFCLSILNPRQNCHIVFEPTIKFLDRVPKLSDRSIDIESILNTEKFNFIHLTLNFRFITQNFKLEGHFVTKTQLRRTLYWWPSFSLLGDCSRFKIQIHWSHVYIRKNEKLAWTSVRRQDEYTGCPKSQPQKSQNPIPKLSKRNTLSIFFRKSIEQSQKNWIFQFFFSLGIQNLVTQETGTATFTLPSIVFVQHLCRVETNTNSRQPRDSGSATSMTRDFAIRPCRSWSIWPTTFFQIDSDNSPIGICEPNLWLGDRSASRCKPKRSPNQVVSSLKTAELEKSIFFPFRIIKIVNYTEAVVRT